MQGRFWLTFSSLYFDPRNTLIRLMHKLFSFFISIYFLFVCISFPLFLSHSWVCLYLFFTFSYLSSSVLLVLFCLFIYLLICRLISFSNLSFVRQYDLNILLITFVSIYLFFFNLSSVYFNNLFSLSIYFVVSLRSFFLTFSLSLIV